MDELEYKSLKIEAELGNVDCQRTLFAYCHKTKQWEQMVYWCERLAANEVDLEITAYTLGLCYKLGCGCEQNKEVAQRWLNIALQYGNEEIQRKAQRDLATLYDKPSKKAAYFLACSVLFTASIFYLKGINFGFRFFVGVWIVVPLIVKFLLRGRQGKLDADARLPGGTCIVSVFACISSLLALLFF